MKKILDNRIVGGGSNTPPTDTLIDKILLEKSVLIDWLSVSFDFVNIEQIGTRDFRIDSYDPLLIQLLSFFGYDKAYDLPLQKGLNGFSHALIIGENIKLMYGLGQKNSNDRHPLNLLISGQGCREFENNMNGKWHELLSFMLVHGSKIKRLDIAIDDYQANEINIYEIEQFIKDYMYVSPLHKTQTITSTDMVGNMRVLSGFSITLGSSASNQLQIYDKKLERRAKGILTDTDIWYRYEMRLTDEKAQAAAELYITAVNENNSNDFMVMASGILYSFLDLKVQQRNGKPSKIQNRSMLDTYSKWFAFLDSVEKIKLKTEKPVETSMIKKKLYFEESYYAFIAEQEMYQGKNLYDVWTKKIMIEGLRKILEEPNRLSKINNGREDLGYKKLTLEDIRKRIIEIEEDLSYLEV
jgi:phage replication initiation protein